MHRVQVFLLDRYPMSKSYLHYQSKESEKIHKIYLSYSNMPHQNIAAISMLALDLNSTLQDQDYHSYQSPMSTYAPFQLALE